MSSLYDLLGVAPDADPDTVRRAYLRAARTSHPDTGGDAETFAAIAAAWEVLSSPETRARYDAELAGDGADVDLGWGDETAYGVPDPPSGPAPAPPTARPGPPGGEGEPPSPRDFRDQLAPPDPFRSPPLSLPTPASTRQSRRRWKPSLVVVGCLVLAQVVRASHPLSGLSALPPVVAAIFACVPMWALGIVARWEQRSRRGLGSVALWFSVGWTALVGLVGISARDETPAVLHVLATMLVTGVWAAVCWRFARWRNAVRAGEHRANLLALAICWNSVLAAARMPGTRIVQAAPSAGRDGQVQVTDPVTGEVARLRLDRTMLGKWLVLLGATPMAHAPADAPRAWSDVLAEAR